MTILMKTHVLIGAAVLLGAASYNSNSFAHPPDGYDMPRKYRTIEKSPTETPIETTGDNADKLQNVAKLSKECQAIMANMKQQNENDNIWGKKETATPEREALEAKIQKCKDVMKNTGMDKK